LLPPSAMGKKGKKSKKQLEEELARQAEEQRKQEEAARQKKAEEDLRREQEERVRRERGAKVRAEEGERLEAENQRVEQRKNERKANLEYEQGKIEAKREWQKFIECNSRPNVALESDLNTYLSTSRAEVLTGFDQAIAFSQYAERVVEDLMDLASTAREEGDEPRQEWCMEYMDEIRTLEMEKIDDATAHMLQHIETLKVTTKQEVQETWGSSHDSIKIGFWGHLQNKGFRAKVIAHDKIHVNLELPKSVATSAPGGSCCIGVRSVYTTYDSVPRSRKKTGSKLAVGGTMRVDLVLIPPVTKQVKQWTLRQIPPKEAPFTKLAYPNQDKHGDATSTLNLPCKVEYKIPADVIVQKEPKVSWWSENEEWSNADVFEIQWEEDSRRVSFFCQRLATYAVTQDKWLDLPYKWWNFRPVSDTQVAFSIQAARFEMQFMIDENGLSLRGPDLPELQHLIRSEAVDDEGTALPVIMSPARLLHKLRDCGINLMPDDNDIEHLPGYQLKSFETEARAFSDLSEIALAFDVTSSKHNKKLEADRALVRIRENFQCAEFDPLDPESETDYRSVMFYTDKCCFVDSMESVYPCNENVREGCETHASFFLCLKQEMQFDEAKQDVFERRTDVSHQNVRLFESVRQTMALMRLLSFT